LPLILFGAIAACGPFAFTTSMIELAAGSTVTVSLTGPSKGRAPNWQVVAVPQERGLTVAVGQLPPNPLNLRGVVSVTAAADAPLGRTAVTVKADEGQATIEVNVIAAPTLKLEAVSRPPTRIAATTTEQGEPVSYVWRTATGGVTQRVDGKDTAVAGLSNVRSVGARETTGWAVTQSNALMKWSLTAPVPETVLDDVQDVSVNPFVAFALRLDGSVVDLTTLQRVEGLSGVVAIRSSGFSQQISNGGGIYRAVSRYFLTEAGVIEAWSTVEYLSQQLPDTSSRSVFARGAIDVTGLGFTQAADGQVLLGNAFLHDLPAKKIDSPPKISNQSNASTLSSAVTCYALFEDGALWRTTVSKTTGENQQGAPTAVSNATQAPVRLPVDEEVDDFVMLGRRVLAFSRDGATFFVGYDDSLEPVSFPGLVN